MQDTTTFEHLREDAPYMPLSEKDAKRTQLFSAGACWIVDEKGKVKLNPNRDSMNQVFQYKGIIVKDPQLPLEIEWDDNFLHFETLAQTASQLDTYEINPRTFGGVTCIEIMHAIARNDTFFVWFSEGYEGHDLNGNPIFRPHGLESIGDLETASPELLKAHLKEFVKNGQSIRNSLHHIASLYPDIIITYSSSEAKNAFRNAGYLKSYHAIRPDVMQTEEIMHALIDFNQGKQVVIELVGGRQYCDEEGRQLFKPAGLNQDFDGLSVVKASLAQYLEEGDELRRSLHQFISQPEVPVQTFNNAQDLETAVLNFFGKS